MVNVSFLRRPYEQGLAMLPKYSRASPYTTLEPLHSKHGPTVSTGNASSSRARASSEDAELKRALAASADLQQTIDQERGASAERLGTVLARYGVQVQQVKADGNCQFRALSFGIYGNEEHHVELRVRTVAHLKGAPDQYQDFVHEPYSEYLDRMARDGQWGDHVTLQAASDALNRVFRVFTDVPDYDFVSVRPTQSGEDDELLQQPLWSVQRPIYMTFQTEVHYDAAYISRSSL